MIDEQAARAARDSWATFLAATGSRFQCVYCAAPYPPGIPPTDRRAVLAHVATCASHPLQAAAARELAAGGIGLLPGPTGSEP